MIFALHHPPAPSNGNHRAWILIKRRAECVDWRTATRPKPVPLTTQRPYGSLPSTTALLPPRRHPHPREHMTSLRVQPDGRCASPRAAGRADGLASHDPTPPLAEHTHLQSLKGRLSTCCCRWCRLEAWFRAGSLPADREARGGCFNQTPDTTRHSTSNSTSNTTPNMRQTR